MSKKKPASANEPPGVVKLFEVIVAMLPGATAFEDIIARSVATKYATENDFFSGAGAAKTGGRWNPVGLPAIYASLDVITATHEAYQNFVKFGFSKAAIRPRVTACAEVSLGKILDLTDSEVRSKIGFSVTELVEEDWKVIQANGEESWTQAIGRACHEAGFEGLVVPSAQYRQGKNIVIFPEKLTKHSKIKILAADQLPK